MLSALVQSRKAWILLLAVAGAVAMNLLGRIDGDKALDFVKWCVSAWMAATAWEDGKKHENPPSPAPPKEDPPS